ETMQVTLPGATYPKNEMIDGVWKRLEPQLASLPGVKTAALFSGLPPVRPPNMNDTDIEGFVRRENGPIQNIDYYQIVSKDYFSTMGIRVMEGRVFDDRDIENGPTTVIVNQTMARTFWPNEEAIGRHIRPSNGPNSPWCTVIGVVEDVKNAGIDRPAGTEIYLPYRQVYGAGQNPMYVAFKTQSGDPERLVSSVRQQIRNIDPQLPISQIKLMDDVISEAQSRPRFLTLLLSIFSGVALAIATIGIYGVISFAVARRTKEFGLRMVLGAQRGDVLGLVMKQGLWLTLVGVGAGLLAAFGLTRLMASLLFGVTATDPLTFASVTAILAAVALFACYIPARRATRVDPIQMMRYE
ncbi:MAG TPA: FtsX-like permease family protein, partial [Candidatus Acidoferrales bacterium]|nr:FtsX-like permease family protein [Candidatus Acidoferrales bacterium]